MPLLVWPAPRLASDWDVRLYPAPAPARRMQRVRVQHEPRPVSGGDAPVALYASDAVVTMPRGARDSSQRVEGMDRFYRMASLVPRV